MCIPVVTGDPTECQRQRYIQLPSTGGTLASIKAAEYGPGSSHCPWHIRAEKGQRINITLHNFARSLEIPSSQSRGPDPCFEFAVVKDGSHRKTVVGCAGEPRVHNVYISRTHAMEIHVSNRVVASQSIYFALQYDSKYLRPILQVFG